MVRTFERTEVQTPSGEEAPSPTRRSYRTIVAWAAVLVALAVALTLAAVVLLDDGDSARGPRAVFTEHGRIKAAESTIDQPAVSGEPFTEHGRIKAAESAVGP